MSLKVEILPTIFEKIVFQLNRDFDQQNLCNKKLRVTQHHQKDLQCIRKWIDNRDSRWKELTMEMKLRIRMTWNIFKFDFTL